MPFQSFAWSSGGVTKQKALLGNATARAALARNIAAAVRDRGADGVNLDFEPIVSGYDDEFTALVRRVRTELDAVQPGYYLTFATTGFIGNYPIEAATGYERYRHGEAIAIGLVAALRLSGAGSLEAEVGELLERAGLPVALDPAIDPGEVLDAVGRDKKRTAAGVSFVLVSAPGSVTFGERVEDASLRRVVEDLLPGIVALAHGPKKARTFVFVKAPRFRGFPGAPGRSETPARPGA